MAAASTEALDPSILPHVASSMLGFPFPELLSCREVTIPPQGAEEEQTLVVLPEGRAFRLQKDRLLAKSLFGAVFHGIEGHCADPDLPSSFLMPNPEHRVNVAVKMSSLAKMNQIPQENVFREISVMRYLSESEGGGHPYVLSLVAACISESNVFMVTPLGAGDLLGMVVRGQGTGEPHARMWIRQVLLGLAYIHSKGLCHHDISPENVVINTTGDAALVMDFGMVQRMQMTPLGDVIAVRDARQFGKLRYMSPEIWNNREYDGRQADIWSTGCMLQICLTGEYLWEAPTRIPCVRRNIYSSDIYSYATLEQHGAAVMLERLNLTSRMSAAAAELLCEILVVDRNSRPCSADLLSQHPFFTAPL